MSPLVFIAGLPIVLMALYVAVRLERRRIERWEREQKPDPRVWKVYPR